jgi:hypothetical protein
MPQSSEQTTPSQPKRREKPIRDMVSTTATTITSIMTVTRDLIQTVGYEVKSSKMESIVEFKSNLKEYSKELGITETELLDLINN